MIKTNATKSIRYAKKGLKWGLCVAVIGAVIGFFAGCMNVSETRYDDIGPCVTGQVDYADSQFKQYSSKDTPANRAALREQGYKIYDCVRKATVSEKSDSEREHALGGLLVGGLSGAAVGCSLPWLAAGWFFFLMLLGQMFDAVRTEPIQSRQHDRKSK